MAVSDEVHNARLALGIKLAAARDAAKYTQKQLARLTNYGRSSIANVETARQNVPRAFWVAADEILGANGELIAAYDQVETLAEAERRRSAKAAAHEKLLGLPAARSLPWHDTPELGQATRLTDPAYKASAGSELSTPSPDVAPLSSRDRLVLAIDDRARELYIRGHGMLHGNQRHEIETAQALLDRAVGRDPASRWRSPTAATPDGASTSPDGPTDRRRRSPEPSATSRLRWQSTRTR
ncbi:helix-turn-helix domain-containing protein [Catellatospora methionotrophica]|uniref:helix-turn-helix domain-containing protein n=1 Tax=Catellatospora methionotrophica TaxID=121620 RepID=UPI00340828B8